MKNALKVLVAIPFNADRAPEAMDRLERAGFELVYNRTGKTYGEAELIEHLPDTFATIASSEPYNQRTLAAGDGVFRVIARVGVGYDQIDVAAATRHNVAVAMAFGTNHEAVADFAFSLLSAMGSNLMGYHEKVAAGRWGGELQQSLWQSTVGIVGLGRIGKALARRCRGFEMRVIAADPVQDMDFARAHGVEYVPLERVFAESDFVSIHCPHMPETDKIVSARMLERMKPSAYLINTSRGGTVDEEALAEALRNHKIAGAGLDVFRTEPLPADSPLRNVPNVIFAPHTAGGNTRSIRDMLSRAADNIIAVRDGQDPGGGLILNPEVLANRG